MPPVNIDFDTDIDIIVDAESSILSEEVTDDEMSDWRFILSEESDDRLSLLFFLCSFLRLTHSNIVALHLRPLFGFPSITRTQFVHSINRVPGSQDVRTKSCYLK